MGNGQHTAENTQSPQEESTNVQEIQLSPDTEIHSEEIHVEENGDFYQETVHKNFAGDSSRAKYPKALSWIKEFKGE